MAKKKNKKYKKKEMTFKEKRGKMLKRIDISSVAMSKEELEKYYVAKDDLGFYEENTKREIPKGYKRCGRCNHVKKFYLFNRNNAHKDNCTGNCKECQKLTAKKSYKKNKDKAKAHERYEQNREKNISAAKQRYQENREDILVQQKEYHQTKKGKKVMKKAQAKRYEKITTNVGIPYTREMVIKRDSKFINEKYPICWICGKPIKDTSGDNLHLDHVISLNNGGNDCFTNIACTHKLCNLSKEKDDRNINNEDVDKIIKRSEIYIDTYPEQFE